ncbi:MAG TPA: complex I subunit 1 family protein, partial [Terracidiphilus sp.]|nr:complex I subunit 1 family protein [Terracidiphilus sp.]
LYLLAPFLALSLALTAIALIPFGPPSVRFPNGQSVFVVSDIDIGLLFLFAITSIGVYGVALAGWSSNSKYPLMGGLRSSAQMISYEVSLTISVVGVLLLAGTLNFNEIISRQSGNFFLHWNVIRTGYGYFPQIVGFLCYLTAAIAETNRIPFDLPEAETELVAGFHTEYSSFKFAMFFMAEYANMITVGCVATLLFLGGWTSPFGDLIGPSQSMFANVVFPIFWFVLKVFCFLFLYVWVRGTLPRFRYDQLMNFGWRFLLPLAILNVVGTSLWYAYRH